MSQQGLERIIEILIAVVFIAALVAVLLLMLFWVKFLWFVLIGGI